jgi:hypothetical protein
MQLPQAALELAIFVPVVPGAHRLTFPEWRSRPLLHALYRISATVGARCATSRGQCAREDRNVRTVRRAMMVLPSCRHTRAACRPHTLPIRCGKPPGETPHERLGHIQDTVRWSSRSGVARPRRCPAAVMMPFLRTGALPSHHPGTMAKDVRPFHRTAYTLLELAILYMHRDLTCTVTCYGVERMLCSWSTASPGVRA